MEQILDTPLEVEKHLNYAGFWIRFAARFIDGIILWVVTTAVNLIFFGTMSSMDTYNLDSYSAGLPFVPVILTLVIYVCYFCGFESSGTQATLGKMAVGIKVGNARGEQISFANALGRYLSKIISSLTLFIGYMMAGWDDKCQALHDKIANTYVFYK